MRTLTLKQYVDDRGRRVETANPDANVVEFCPQGGGPVYKMGHGVFHNTFKPAPEPEFAPVKVTGDWLPPETALAAYSDGQRWNGWEMPHFEKEEADRLAALTGDLRYDPERDAFVQRIDGGGDSDEDVWTAQTIRVAGADVKVYAIGAGSWCWDEV